MEEDTVTTVNEQLENLEDSTEDSGQEKLAAQASQVNPDTTVDEDSRRAPDNNELNEPSRDETSEASNGNLEEWGYLNKPNFPTVFITDQLTILGTLGHWLKRQRQQLVTVRPED